VAAHQKTFIQTDTN